MHFILINFGDNADTPGNTPYVDIEIELVVTNLDIWGQFITAVLSRY
jgi:hypothetical protein